MKKLTNLTKVTIAIFFAMYIFFSPVVGGVAAYASSTKYTDVVNDLLIDKSFSVDDYPINDEDYTLQVIQIAETKSKQLLVYVYNPSAPNKPLTATSINISTEINNSLHYQNYTLSLLNSRGVFAKYIVNEFTVKDDLLRYYDISSIFRQWDKDIDETAGNLNEISEISFEVGKRYTASTVEGKVTYTCMKRETIVITSKHVGFIEYLNGFKLFTSYCDSHYVAFDTDMEIGALYEADVEYIPIAYKKWRNLVGKDDYEYKNPQDKRAITLHYDDVVTNDKALFGKEYVWTRIEKAEDFVRNEDLTDEAKKNVSDKKWVLRFFESECKELPQFGTGKTAITGTLVEDVTILRLKFETNGTVYNLGVVDNKQSQTWGQEPDNNNTNEFEFWGVNAKDWIKIAKIAGIVILAVIVFVLVVKFLKWLFKGGKK